MWFRLLTLVLALFAWAVTLWLPLHQSGESTFLGRYSGPYLSLILASAAAALVCTALATRGGNRWLRDRIQIPAVVLFSSLLSLAAAEGLVRATDLIGISYYEECRLYLFDKLADEHLHSRHPANHRATYQGVEVATNEIGLRERPIGEKAPGEFRILFLGDSVTFGWGVRVEDTFPRRLEERLQRRTTRTVRAINSGVAGYNTAMEAAFLGRHGADIAPDLVVLLYVANDAELTPTSTYDPRSDSAIDLRSPPRAIRRLLWKSWLYRLARHAWSYGLPLGTEDSAVDDDLATTGVRMAASPGWLASMQGLVQMADFCAQREIPFATFVYRFANNRWLAAATEEIKAMAESEGFHAGDLRLSAGDPAFRELISSPADSHPNAAGHALLAAKLEDSLMAWEILR